MKIPEIQPFQFIRGTAFSERVQLANKVNEIIDGINSIGENPDIQAQIDTINSTIAQIQADIANTDTEISGIQSQVNTLIQEVNGLLSEVVNEIVVDSPGYGQVRVKLIHEDESETASNALQIPVIQDGGITLISGTTDRSFKIQYITMDGVTHTTNDFVIPEGGGTAVTVTSISILQGDTANDIKFQVGLSDGSTIQSNSYPIPQAPITPATTSQIGGIKVGTNLSVTADGTLSVDMTTIGKTARADSITWTADASKVTLHGDSLNGSDFTKDIPQASQGGAGTIDHASYAKIAANESAISELKADVAALAPSVSVNEEADPPTITVGINGKEATANLPAGGNGWEEIDITNIPRDFEEGDIVIFTTKINATVDSAPSSWSSTPPSRPKITFAGNSSILTYIHPTNVSTENPICTVIGSTYIIIVYVSYVSGYEELNTGNTLFRVACRLFNGAEISPSQGLEITRDIATTYITRMLRYKAKKN